MQGQISDVVTARPHGRSGMVTVDLRADGGSSATCDGAFFRSPEYMRAEGVTHTLGIHGPESQASVPLVVRDIPGTDCRDAVSPYGYPGATVLGPSVDLRDCDLSGLGIVSLFLRDHVGRPSLTGGVVKAEVHLYDPLLERSPSKSFRRAVRRCETEGYRVDVTSGTDVDDGLLDGFHRVYGETMRRRDAHERYLFSRSYLRSCLDTGTAHIVHATAPDGVVAAADLLVESDGVLHALLGGTGDDFLRMSPGKAVITGGMDLAEKLGLPYNAGGALVGGDGVEQSKLAYCNRTAPFFCHEIVCDPDAYARLAAGRAAGSFFPAYRAG